jgi:small-conductance mechanosensitive channel
VRVSALCPLGDVFPPAPVRQSEKTPGSVSDRTTSQGLTQFERRRATLARKLQNRNAIDAGPVAAAGVCDNQCGTARKSFDSKDGEMSEWLKEHAWKAKRTSSTKRFRSASTHTQSAA